MSASGFSNVNPTLEPLKETIEVLKDTIDKNNFKDVKLLKSIYDESFDIANEFFSSKKEGFEDDDEEGFEDDDEEGFEGEEDDDEGFEGEEDDDEGFEGEEDDDAGFEEEGIGDILIFSYCPQLVLYLFHKPHKFSL